MSYTDTQSLRVKVGDLLPGSFYGDSDKPLEDSRNYFPAFNWALLEATFSQLDEDSSLPGKEWPLWPVWREWMLRRFGAIPTKSSALSKGKLWTWERWEEKYRKMHKSWQAGGYDPGKIARPGEDYELWIERHGELCVAQGNKRVALLRIKKEPGFEIDAKIVARHPEWSRSKKALFEVAGKEDLYQPLDHPDFNGWTVTQPCVERLAMIGKFLPDDFSGQVLDIGCHTGWFVRRFAARGCSATGIEKQPALVRVARDIAQFRHDNRPQGHYKESSALEYMEATDATVDVVLCLSLIMHTFGESHETAWRLLDLISQRSKVMFLDCVWGGYAKHLPFTEATMSREIISKTRFTESAMLGRTQHENRPFRVFWRQP